MNGSIRSTKKLTTPHRAACLAAKTWPDLEDAIADVAEDGPAHPLCPAILLMPSDWTVFLCGDLARHIATLPPPVVSVSAASQGPAEPVAIIGPINGRAMLDARRARQVDAGE